MKSNKNISKNFKGIIDTTLREGFQFVKANFSKNEQMQIFEYLLNIGVDYIELSNPTNQVIKKTIKILLKNKGKSKTKILAHVRNRLTDLKNAADIGIDGVNILCTADHERLSSMKSNLESHLEELENNVYYAKKHQLEVRVSVEDSFTQSQTNTMKIFNKALFLNVERIGIADTLGRAMRWEITKLVKKIKKLFGTDIELHLHNDLGQAISNTLAGLAAGANWIDTTLLGIGERTGIVSLSQLLTNLYILNPNLTQKYNLKILTDAENYIAHICHIETPFNLITNKTNGFAHKAGIHLNALIKHGPKKYELFPPDLIGNKRTLVYNTTLSGRTSQQDIEKFYKMYGQ